MSTILKALRRLEQEKNTRSDRPLAEAVAGAAPVPASRAAASRRWPMFAGIAIGIIVLGAGAYAAIRWIHSDSETVPVEVAAVPAEPETPVIPGRRQAAPARAKAKQSPANRRSPQTRNTRAQASAALRWAPANAARRFGRTTFRRAVSPTIAPV